MSPFPVVAAILSSLFFAASNTAAKRGLSGSNPPTAFFVDIITASIIFAVPLIYFMPVGAIPLAGIAWFAVSGVVGTTLGRITQFYAIERMGAAIATPVANIFPIFSTAAAVLFLGESLTVLVIAGTLLTVVGLFVISLRSDSRNWNSRYLVVPLSSAAFFGIGVALRNMGLDLIPSPLFGVAITVYAGLASFLFFLVISKRYRSQIKLAKKNIKYFAFGGVMDSLALIALFEALEFGQVIVVGPLSSVPPLFVLVFAYLFLKQIEVVSRRLVLAAIIIVAGLVLVAI